jgi:hypothetical protein
VRTTICQEESKNVTLWLLGNYRSFSNSNIEVYNVSGMEISKSTMNGANAQLNIESLSNGVYFVKVSNENGFNKTASIAHFPLS